MYSFDSSKWLTAIYFALLLPFPAVFTSATSNNQIPSLDLKPGYESEGQNIISSQSELPSQEHLDEHVTSDYTNTQAINVLHDLHNALETMQSEYFTLWAGKWATAIDWTSAVIGTHLSATLSSLSHSVAYTMPGTFDKSRKLDVEAQMVENEINKYFSQTITYFFGEEVFSIRNQAFDDMLWVVLGWLESIQFIENHSLTHYTRDSDGSQSMPRWHAQQFIPAFAHRARIFYELAGKGWDWKLCGGGMNWNPRLLPYKNAITNELWISASIAMYLYFPGDDNCSPFVGVGSDKQNRRFQMPDDALGCFNADANSTYDPKYLENAINGYDWLKNSHMLNEQGLYTDGFHIKDYAKNHSKTECNERNEMVYTYNQGVILSGLRGLWEATGNVTYLEDGHELIRNVMEATGYTNLNPQTTLSFASENPQATKLKSRLGGPTNIQQVHLGTHGILEEACDLSGTCSQDGQTFKSIFFHHLAVFCTPLPSSPATPGKTHAASKEIATLHHRGCEGYTNWVVLNAHAALKTRDEKGRFGMWWGANEVLTGPEQSQPVSRMPSNAIDYHNDPIFFADRDSYTPDLSDFPDVQIHSEDEHEDEHDHQRQEYRFPSMTSLRRREVNGVSDDPNERGRGRTVETQAGGVAVVRAMWEFLRRYGGE